MNKICKNCNKGILEIVNGNLPYNIQHYQCSNCDSTYNKTKFRFTYSIGDRLTTIPTYITSEGIDLDDAYENALVELNKKFINKLIKIYK